LRNKKYVNIIVIGLVILFAGASGLSSISAKNISELDKDSLTTIPVGSLFEGNTYFILLDDYTDGAGQNNHWAVQLRFDSANNIVESEYDGIQLPLVYDKWAEIRVEIDLDNDWHEVFYDGTFFYEKEWTAGINNDYQGVLTIDAVDLFANGATSVYYDDMSLEQVGTGVVWSDNFDSYADGSSMHGQGGWKGWDNDPIWTAYVTSAQSQSSPHSVDIKQDADLVHEYSGYTTGQYVYTAYQYIPSVQGDPPGAPTINGPANGDAGDTLTYSFSAVDPDGDDVRFIVEWGDGNTDTTGFVASGATQTADHIWATPATYTITAKAEDTNGNIGPESTFTVTIPRNKVVNANPFIQFLQNHPNIFPLLRQLFGL
jgi:hypothetical protein